MDASDPLVTALDRLCTKEGGWKAVASKLGVNDQSLYQITTGKKLPSGNPKGVGPKLRNLLDEHYPGWRDIHTSPIGRQHPATDPLQASENTNKAAAYIQARALPPLPQVIDDLARHMRQLDPPLRNAVGALLAGLCAHPESAHNVAQTIHAMLSVQGNGPAQKSINSQAA